MVNFLTFPPIFRLISYWFLQLLQNVMHFIFIPFVIVIKKEVVKKRREWKLSVLLYNYRFPRNSFDCENTRSNYRFSTNKQLSYKIKKLQPRFSFKMSENHI